MDRERERRLDWLLLLVALVSVLMFASCTASKQADKLETGGAADQIADSSLASQIDGGGWGDGEGNPPLGDGPGGAG